MNRTCSHCGAEALAEDARHCHQCGAVLDPGTEPLPPGSVADIASTPSKESRNWGVAANLSTFLALAVVGFTFLGPLAVWLLKRHEDTFVEAHAREALNFNLTVLILVAIGIPLALVGIGFLLLLAVAIAWVVLTIRGAIAASNGEAYRYPFTIRFVS